MAGIIKCKHRDSGPAPVLNAIRFNKKNLDQILALPFIDYVEATFYGTIYQNSYELDPDDTNFADLHVAHMITDHGNIEVKPGEWIVWRCDEESPASDGGFKMEHQRFNRYYERKKKWMEKS